jgi:transposase-like protein
MKNDIVTYRQLSRLMKYTVKQLQADFPDDAACLEWLVKYLYPEGVHCVKCEEITNHYKVSGRRSYVCSHCGNHFYPTAGTIFHKSTTPLTDWFHAIYIMSTNKAGTSARQIQRETGVTYKTAWRMMHKIRSMMDGPDDKLETEVEVDETYVHPNVYKRSSAKRKHGRNGRDVGQILFGVVQRGGPVKIWHVKSSGVRVLRPLILSNVEDGAIVHTDGHGSYRTLPHYGYEHRTTNHERHEYYTPDSYTQNIENVWSHIKRGIKGVYRHVDADYLQLYANEYAWRYNHRKQPVLFWHLLADTTLPSSFSSARKRLVSSSLPSLGQ